MGYALYSTAKSIISAPFLDLVSLPSLGWTLFIEILDDYYCRKLMMCDRTLINQQNEMAEEWQVYVTI